MKFSEHLKNLRKEKNMTQVELSEKIGITSRQIQKYESGAARPRLEQAQKTSYDAKKDSFYQTYAKKSNYQIVTPKSLPKLYLSVRNYAIKNYNYKVSGTNPFNIGNIIKGVANEYGYNSIKTSHILIWSYDGQVLSEINAGYPTIWNCANSSTYGSHSMVVTGYKQYRKTTTILGIKFYSYVDLMQVNDNWSSSARYFDFTNYGAFGSFVKVR